MAREKRSGTDSLPFAKRLKLIMSERDLTVRAIAEMAGASSSVAQSWISGANPHDLQAVGRLSKALGISFRELLLGEPEVAVGAIRASDFFDEKDLFEGICRVSITKLTPKK